MKFIGIACALVALAGLSPFRGAVLNVSEPFRLVLWGVALIAFSCILRGKLRTPGSVQNRRSVQRLDDIAGSPA